MYPENSILEYGAFKLSFARSQERAQLTARRGRVPAEQLAHAMNSLTLGTVNVGKRCTTARREEASPEARKNGCFAARAHEHDQKLPGKPRLHQN